MQEKKEGSKFCECYIQKLVMISNWELNRKKKKVLMYAQKIVNM